MILCHSKQETTKSGMFLRNVNSISENGRTSIPSTLCAGDGATKKCRMCGKAQKTMQCSEMVIQRTLQPFKRVKETY